MVSPISNDKIIPSDSTGSAVTDKKKADQGAVTLDNPISNPVATEENSPETSSVDIGRANQVYNSATAKPSSGEDVITSPEQAKAIASEIRTQIETNGRQALRAQAGASSGGLAALLEAAPV